MILCNVKNASTASAPRWEQGSTDEGENSELASEGRKLPMDDMVELFAIDQEAPKTIFAICSEGGLFRSDSRCEMGKACRAMSHLRPTGLKFAIISYDHFDAVLIR